MKRICYMKVEWTNGHLLSSKLFLAQIGLSHHVNGLHYLLIARYTSLNNGKFATKYNGIPNWRSGANTELMQ